ncbi:hypothetical protein VW23_006810 [Devosia insulae DS-56]|uniref:Polysaccharide pyruvyl transferase domain-containing protein n=1 Tax=Devosia insulae DS-56 TaxID=1116389 RepID=A0A1E5XHD9_9HYPH|nr:polysaccharide pyruvyl transferase family protein [Devosia insulae]OEO28007.1 hypothetical protein VW23_006810 [Devosia insulae DS-56]
MVNLKPVRAAFRSLTRRHLTGRTIDIPGVIVTWYGSFGARNGATLGDLMAVDNFSQDLRAAGVEHAVISGQMDWSGHLRVESPFMLKPKARALVFVCGPLTNDPHLVDVLAVHRNARKLAVGVSVLAQQPGIVDRFDVVVARDGTDSATFDLAVSSVVPPTVQPHLRTVGLCFRGAQQEYGTASLHDRAEGLLRELAAKRGLDVRIIDTVLRPDNTPTDIRNAFAAVDCVFTTRMHGALLSLAAGKPVLAVDQVPGSAKVLSVVGATGWPFLYRADDVELAELERDLLHLEASPIVNEISRAQSRMLELSRDARAQGVAALQRLLRQTTGGTKG